MNVSTLRTAKRKGRGDYIMVDAKIYIFAAVLLFFDKASGQAAAPSVDDGATLLTLDRGVEAKILSTGQADCSKLLLVAQLFGAVFHQSLEFCQCLLDL